MSEPVATVTVEGVKYDKWESGTVRLTMDEFTNSFEVSWIDDGQGPGIYRGDLVDIALDGDVVIKGVVLSTGDDDAPDSLTRTAGGQAITGVLISAADQKPRRWQKSKVSEIAKALGAQRGITVKVAGDEGKPIPLVAIERGEFSADVIGRIATKRGLIPYTVVGDLVLARVGTTKTSTVLRRGVNVVRWSRSDSEYERYSEYRYVAQTKPSDKYGAPVQQIYASIKDEGIGYLKPLLVQIDASDTIDAKSRATLERNQRAGRGEQITVIVNEWLTDEGRAWRPNTIVRAVNPVLGIDGDFVIVSATYRFGAQSPREVELVLTHPSAYDSAANYPVRKRRAKWS